MLSRSDQAMAEMILQLGQFLQCAVVSATEILGFSLEVGVQRYTHDH